MKYLFSNNFSFHFLREFKKLLSLLQNGFNLFLNVLYKFYCRNHRTCKKRIEVEAMQS